MKNLILLSTLALAFASCKDEAPAPDSPESSPSAPSPKLKDQAPTQKPPRQTPKTSPPKRLVPPPTLPTSPPPAAGTKPVPSPTPKTETEAETPPTPQVSKYQTAVSVPRRPGWVFNPWTNKAVDVRGIPPGSVVRDPNDSDPDHKFRVP